MQYSFEKFWKGGETVKSKMLFISLAVVLALSLVLTGCPTNGGGVAPTSIKVGLVREVDHPDLAVFDWIAGGPVYRYYSAHVNEDVGHAGEIHLDVYDSGSEEAWVPVELVKRTFDMTNWATLGQQTLALINVDNVDFIWAPTSTDAIYTMAPICNANAMLLTTMEGGASKMVWEHESYLDVWPFVWVSLSFSNWYELPVLADMMDDAVGGDAKAYVTYIGGYGAEHGQEYLQEAQNAFGTGDIVAEVEINPTGFDATAAQTLINNAKTALGDPGSPNYDIFCCFAYPALVEPITQAAIDLDFNPPAMVFGPGANFGYYAYNFEDAAQNITSPPGDGRLVDGILCFAVATPETTINVGTPTMSMADMYTAMATQLDADVLSGACAIPLPGALLLDYWGDPCYIAALEMWKYAVEDVGDLDSVAIRNVLASYSSSSAASTVFGSTWFAVWPEAAGGNFTGTTGGGVMDYLCHTGEIGQWQELVGANTSIMEIVGPGDEGEAVTGLPNYDITANFKYPMTDEWYWIKND
jgi:hypothetical protein